MSVPSLTPWTTSAWPTKTVLSSVNPTHTSALFSSLSSAAARAQTDTDPIDLISLSRIIRGAQASLSIISAEQVLATATADSIQAQATRAIFEQTVNLKDLAREENLYNMPLNHPANIIYLVVYAIIFAYITGMLVKSRYHWFNITFFCGYALEFAGFLGRVLSLTDNTNLQYYLLQYVPLTIAPAFIMAGIYFLFAQLVVIHGRKYSVLKPMWYSYFFIASDVLSLMVQAIGGGMASAASKDHKDTKPGTDVMIVGICIQVVAMTIFVVFWFEFLNRLFFKDSKDIKATTESPYTKRSFANFFRFLFNTKSSRDYRQMYQDSYYNQNFKSIRERKLLPYFPLALTIAVVLIYIRCVYRVVELAQGFTGYLVTHEVYLMVLDAFMIAISGLIFIPFHPVLVFGSTNLIKVATIKKNLDEKSTNDTRLQTMTNKMESVALII
ncbi:putative transporter or flippase transmembrane protein [Suhomyces tanzawaensis NRRL Y-17324]|uniref:Sphingoid long-chain base transporter RSB1 n=1 Tax=Suhomyces tanzawaensis NRRL Y-17324 TaxID=984487 RepID=A0A1E4SMS0_9ASCO|nr:putative transporter or flippase transmembrane protein [Suhomyces tanzawaensis NRRL Y-17324]ODV80682.1 putative transporter or flippase transmembrane protein [Suhomyces tanzawaensis NRRL Y-17324]